MRMFRPGAGLLLLFVLLLTRPGSVAAQFIVQPADSLLPDARLVPVIRLLNDSLERLQQYERQRQWPQVQRLSTTLLTRYPGRVAQRPAGAEPVSWVYQNYPYDVYASRLQARRVLNDYQGQEADLTSLIRYNQVVESRAEAKGRFYVERGTLRLQHLNDPAGGCADLQEAYRYNAEHLPLLQRWRCPVPVLRYALNATDYPLAEAALNDSLAVIGQLLKQQHFAAALRSAHGLRAGRVGAYLGVRAHTSTPLLALRAQARQGLGDLPGATADYDSAVAATAAASPAVRAAVLYQRGIYRLDHQSARADGCADLTRAYDLDPAPSRPQDVRWRGCALTYKLPLGPEQKRAAIQHYRDSVAAARLAVLAGHYATARRTCDLLLAGYAGPFRVERIGVIEDELFRGGPLLRGLALEWRALAWQGLGDYQQALADFDAAVQEKNYGAYCTRGLLKIDHLRDAEGGCADLNRCASAGYRLPAALAGRPRWRGCDITARHFSQRYLEPVSALFADADHVTPRVGAFYQGAPGLEVGLLFSPGEWLATYGPSIGADVVLQPLLLAPKLSYEGELAFVGGRLDVAYYLGSYQGAPRGDLRLTPQIGVSAGALLNLFYGYSLPVAGQEIGALGRHRVSLYINFLKISKLGG